jgi:hypothetical protein
LILLRKFLSSFIMDDFPFAADSMKESNLPMD